MFGLEILTAGCPVECQPIDAEPCGEEARGRGASSLTKGVFSDCYSQRGKPTPTKLPVIKKAWGTIRWIGLAERKACYHEPLSIDRFPSKLPVGMEADMAMGFGRRRERVLPHGDDAGTGRDENSHESDHLDQRAVRESKSWVHCRGLNYPGPNAELLYIRFQTRNTETQTLLMTDVAATARRSDTRAPRLNDSFRQETEPVWQRS
ncbi:hypothetical protein C8R48DRAFT_759914 [Suillus tomentosus]|nr:hypothetical protein C8R48DRAFT_759914 [Suillus tomentosus]